MSEDKLKRIFADNLNYYLTKTGKKQDDLVTDLDLSASTVSSWCTGQKFPRMNKVEMLANYFGLEKSDLIEEKGKEDSDFHRKITLLTRKVEDMPPEDREMIHSLIESTIDTYLKAKNPK